MSAFPLALDEMLWILRWWARKRDRTLQDLDHALTMARWLLEERREKRRREAE